METKSHFSTNIQMVMHLRLLTNEGAQTAVFHPLASSSNEVGIRLGIL